MTLGRVRAWSNPFEPHELHQALDPFPIDRIPVLLQPDGHASRPIKRGVKILFIQQPHKMQILLALCGGVIIIGRPRQSQQITVLLDTHHRIMPVNQLPFLLSGLGPVFF